MPACPACDAPCEATPIHSFTAGEAAQHFVLRDEYPERHVQLHRKIAALWNSERCDVIACGACELRFAWPFVAGDGDFYNLAYPYSSYPKDRWEFGQTLDALSASPLLDGLVMEIGSGFGHFLTRLSPRFVPADRVIAVEYNEFARGRLARAGFAARGEDVRAASFDGLRNRLAAVFMFQVLEHMDGLDRLLARLRELALPGASLFVAVPNAQRIAFNESHGALYDMPPNHISRWTRPAFEALAARSGLELVAYRTEPVSLPTMVRQDLVSAHMRSAQRAGSLANRLRSRPRNRGRLALEALAALASIPSRIPAWIDAAPAIRGLGDSAWVHLRFEPSR